jgi:hypothetical protein
MINHCYAVSGEINHIFFPPLQSTLPFTFMHLVLKEKTNQSSLN